MFIGHTHIAGIFYKDDMGDIRYTDETVISLQSQMRYLINVGSIGQPRDGNWYASYCIYDDKEDVLRIKRIGYNVRGASEKILKSGLPAHLAERILVGW